MKSNAWRQLSAGLGRRRRRFARPIDWLVSLLLAAVGFGFFVPGTDDSNPKSNIYFATALLVWVIAASWRLWRAPERGLPEARRWRLRHRLVCWRLSQLLLLGACLALLACSYYEWRSDLGSASLTQFDHDNSLATTSGSTGLWLLLTSALPALLDVPLWQLWPLGVRDAAMKAKATEELMKRSARFGRQQAFSFTVDVLGRPPAASVREPGDGLGPALTLRTTQADCRKYTVYNQRPASYYQRWVANSSLGWDGVEDLVFTDGRARTVRRPAAEAAEAVLFIERTTRLHESRYLLLLDRQGRRLLAVPADGYALQDLGDLAHAAGLRFSFYSLGDSSKDRGEVNPRLFPRKRGTVTLRL